MKEQLSLLFDKYCSPTLSWIRKSTKIQAQGNAFADIGDLQCRACKKGLHSRSFGDLKGSCST